MTFLHMNHGQKKEEAARTDVITSNKSKGQQHSTNLLKIPPTCSNYGNKHTATFRGCLVYKKIIQEDTIRNQGRALLRSATPHTILQPITPMLLHSLNSQHLLCLIWSKRIPSSSFSSASLSSPFSFSSFSSFTIPFKTYGIRSSNHFLFLPNFLDRNKKKTSPPNGHIEYSKENSYLLLDHWMQD